MNPNILVTLPLADLITSILGSYSEGLDKSIITFNTALAIGPHLLNNQFYIIEYTSKDGIPLKHPILWRYNDWKTSQNNYDNQKAFSERERVKSFLLKTNVDNLTRVLMKYHKLDESYARNLAYSVIKNGNDSVIQFLGLNKIAKTEEDL